MCVCGGLNAITNEMLKARVLCRTEYNTHTHTHTQHIHNPYTHVYVYVCRVCIIIYACSSRCALTELLHEIRVTINYMRVGLARAGSFRPPTQPAHMPLYIANTSTHVRESATTEICVRRVFGTTLGRALSHAVADDLCTQCGGSDGCYKLFN